MSRSDAGPGVSAEQAAEQMRDATDRIRDHWAVVDMASAATAQAEMVGRVGLEPTTEGL